MFTKYQRHYNRYIMAKVNNKRIKLDDLRTEYRTLKTSNFFLTLLSNTHFNSRYFINRLLKSVAQTYSYTLLTILTKTLIRFFFFLLNIKVRKSIPLYYTETLFKIIL